MGILSRLIPIDRFHLDPEYFPEETKDLFSVEEIVKHGILPLGYKKSAGGRRLNVGFVDPHQEAALELVKAKVNAQKAIDGFRRYRVGIEEFLQVNQVVYNVFPTAYADSAGDGACSLVVEFLKEAKKKKEAEEDKLSLK